MSGVDAGRLKVVTWNLNGIRAVVQRNKSLAQLLESMDADVIAFQETKVSRSMLTEDLAVCAGWDSFFDFDRTRRTGYSGVATFTRNSKTTPCAACRGVTGIGEDCGSIGCVPTDGLSAEEIAELRELDSEGRCVATDHGPDAFVLFNVYVPALSQEENFEERLKMKLRILRVLERRLQDLRARGRHVVIVGDFNISPTPLDHCDPDANFARRPDRRWLQALLANPQAPTAAPGGSSCCPSGGEQLDPPRSDGGSANGALGGQLLAAHPAASRSSDVACHFSDGSGSFDVRADATARQSSAPTAEQSAEAHGADFGKLGAPGRESGVEGSGDGAPQPSSSRARQGGFVDAFRHFHAATAHAYTCWSVCTGARENNWGTRIDLILVANPLLPPLRPTQAAGASLTSDSRAASAALDVSLRAASGGRAVAGGAPAGLDAAAPSRAWPWEAAMRDCRIEADFQGSDHAPCWLALDTAAMPPGALACCAAAPPLPASSVHLFKGGKQSTLRSMWTKSAADGGAGSQLSGARSDRSASACEPSRASTTEAVLTSDSSALPGAGAARSGSVAGSLGVAAPPPVAASTSSAALRPARPQPKAGNGLAALGGVRAPGAKLGPGGAASRRAASQTGKKSALPAGTKRTADQASLMSFVKLPDRKLQTASIRGGASAAEPSDSRPVPLQSQAAVATRAPSQEDAQNREPPQLVRVGADRPMAAPGGALACASGSAAAADDAAPLSAVGSERLDVGQDGISLAASAGPEEDVSAQNLGDGPQGPRAGPGAATVRGASLVPPEHAAAAWKGIMGKMKPALCKGHAEECVIRQVKKKGANQNRLFYVCARSAGPPPHGRCDHFEWIKGLGARK